MFLLFNAIPDALPYAYAAKQKLDAIEVRQELLIAQEGDKYELDVYGLMRVTLMGSPINSVEDVTGVTWKSSNTKVATVSKKGVVTAKKSGKCIITASWGKLKAECKVRVYTKEELYSAILDADIAHDSIYMALNTNIYKMEEFIYATENFPKIADMKIKAAKEVKKILDSVFEEGMTDYEKLMGLTEWIFENIEIIKNYRSKFTKDNLRNDNAYYYIDPLIYRKASHQGISDLLELLLNCGGIRCEQVWGVGGSIAGCNLVELDGDFYYFNIMNLADEMDELSEELGEQLSFYDLLVTKGTMVDQFLNYKLRVYTMVGVKDYANRSSHYDNSSWDYDVSLDGDDERNPNIYSHYFYDFYNDKIRYVTKKEDRKNPDISVKPYFSYLPTYPESKSSKYKDVMRREAEFIEKVKDLEEEAIQTSQYLDEGYFYFDYELVNLNNSLNEIMTEFESIKDTFTMKKIGNYMEKEFQKAKELVKIAVDKFNQGGYQR
jgi:hypothetical protein